MAEKIITKTARIDTDVNVPFALFLNMWFNNCWLDRNALITLSNLINLKSLPAL